MKPRHAPALVVLALVAGAALVAWLAGGEVDDRRGHRPARVATERAAPKVDLSPPAPTTIDDPTTSSGSSTSTSATPTTTASDAPPPVATPSAPPERSSLRPVRGLVRDAATKAPIAGAWIAWRYPTPEACAWALEGDRREFAGEMITDAEGRFALTRLADDEGPTPELFAVARGYAIESLRPGLRDEVTFELVGAGTLEVTTSDAEGLRLQVESIAEPLEPEGDAWRLRHVVGTRDVRLVPGGEWREVTVVAGRTTRVELPRPAEGEVDLGALAGRGVVLQALDGTNGLLWPEAPQLGSAPAGRYAVLVSEGASEVRVGDVTVVAGRRAAVEPRPAPPRYPVEVRVNGLGGDWLSLTPLDGSDRWATSWRLDATDAEPTVWRGGAGGGRCAIALGDLPLGEVTLPATGPIVVDARPFQARLRLRGPAALGPEEALRVRLTVVPAFLADHEGARAQVARELVASAGPRAEPVLLELVVPGDHVVSGVSDLGPFSTTVDLRPDADVEVRLGE